MSLLAAICAALAVWLTLRPPNLHRLAKPPPAVPRTAARTTALPWLLVPLFAFGGALVRGSEGIAIGLALGLVSATLGVVLRRHRRQRRVATAAKEVYTACQQLAGLIRVGHVPAAALRIAAADSSCLAEVAAAQQIGSPVGAALLRLGALPGRSGLAELGVAWEVAERTGASLPATVDALADRLASRRKVSGVVATELAAPRATGRLLAVLPGVGLLLGYSFGGDPLSFLASSLVGQISLVLGVGLGCLGVLWTERLADEGGRS